MITAADGVTIAGFVQDLVFGDKIPLNEGLVTTLAFLLIGVLVAWRNGRRIPLSFIAQFCYSTLCVRYFQSYWMFHHSMREGLWPFAWITASLIGIWLARPGNFAGYVLAKVLSRVWASG